MCQEAHHLEYPRSLYSIDRVYYCMEYSYKRATCDIQYMCLNQGAFHVPRYTSEYPLAVMLMYVPIPDLFRQCKTRRSDADHHEQVSAHSESLAHEYWAACRIPRSPKHILPGIDPASFNLQISYHLHPPFLPETYPLANQSTIPPIRPRAQGSGWR